MSSVKNPQIQAIDQAIMALGVINVPQYISSITQIDLLKKQLTTIDKTNIPLYMSILERLYNLQQNVATSNSEQVNTLLAQRVQLLESLTSSG